MASLTHFPADQFFFHPHQQKQQQQQWWRRRRRKRRRRRRTRRTRRRRRWWRWQWLWEPVKKQSKFWCRYSGCFQAWPQSHFKHEKSLEQLIALSHCFSSKKEMYFMFLLEVPKTQLLPWTWKIVAADFFLIYIDFFFHLLIGKVAIANQPLIIRHTVLKKGIWLLLCTSFTTEVLYIEFSPVILPFNSHHYHLSITTN
jgi:hypothetical protein